MDWMPVVGTVAGAAVALAGALVADLRRERSQRSREWELDRWKTYVDIAEALDGAHSTLRGIACSTSSGPDRQAAARRAVHDSGIYRIRERMLMSASTPLAQKGEATFLKLIDIRNAVGAGATLAMPEYHDAYHPFAEALWAFRNAVRTELGEQALIPAILGKTSWPEREQCSECRMRPVE